MRVTVDIDIEHVSVSFGRRTVLDDVTATMRGGRLTALVGPSGSGKSTLLALAAGYLVPASGRVLVRSETFGTGAEPPHPGRVAWVPQGANALGARSVLDNVMLGALSEGVDLAGAARRARACLATVGLAERAGDAARELSGGELQRVAFARALVSRRATILADEPTASLDAASTREIVRLLRELRIDATVVVATHDPLVIEAADEIVDLREAHRG